MYNIKFRREQMTPNELKEIISILFQLSFYSTFFFSGFIILMNSKTDAAKRGIYNAIYGVK